MLRTKRCKWGTEVCFQLAERERIIQERERELMTMGGRTEEGYEFCYLEDVLVYEAIVVKAVRARAAAQWKNGKVTRL